MCIWGVRPLSPEDRLREVEGEEAGGCADTRETAGWGAMMSRS
jgi:hypothetical protein